MTFTLSLSFLLLIGSVSPLLSPVSLSACLHDVDSCSWVAGDVCIAIIAIIAVLGSIQAKLTLAGPARLPELGPRSCSSHLTATPTVSRKSTATAGRPLTPLHHHHHHHQLASLQLYSFQTSPV